MILSLNGWKAGAEPAPTFCARECACVRGDYLALHPRLSVWCSVSALAAAETALRSGPKSSDSCPPPTSLSLTDARYDSIDYPASPRSAPKRTSHTTAKN
ncbi:hypothetical protein J6590_048691 [Homalodisca vitripennis]|nr:hypothetical protein J6590_048691 [Homalodisca vitripennis]